MDELARRAGVTKPVIYELFGSKEGLFRACLEGLALRLAEAIAEAARGADEAGAAPDPEARLRAGGLAFLRFASDNRMAYELLYEGRFSDAAVTVRRRQAALILELMREMAPAAWTRASWSWRRTPSTRPTRVSPTGCGTTRTFPSSGWRTGPSSCSCQDYGGSRDAAPSDRDRRHRLLGARHGDQAETGGRARLRAARARRRHRRHLAREHLSGLPLRRALSPLLVLVRAEPELVEHLLAAGGDPRLPEGRREPPRRAAARELRYGAGGGGVGRRRAAVADRDVERRNDGRRADCCARSA